MVLTTSMIFVILTAAILFLIAIVVILEKSLKSKKQAQISSPESALTEELISLKKANLEPQEMMQRIDSLAKKAISNQNSLGHMDYSQIAEINKEKVHIVQFCAEMTESLYAGEKITHSQVRSLINSLEDLLKGEGKLVLIRPKKEIIEGKSSFFLDNIIERTAKKVNAKLQEIKNKNTEQENKVTEINKIESSETNQEKEIPMPEFKKQVLIKKQKKGSKDSKIDKAEYRYIESVDVLDRIQNKIKQRKTVKV